MVKCLKHYSRSTKSLVSMESKKESHSAICVTFRQFVGKLVTSRCQEALKLHFHSIGPISSNIACIWLQCFSALIITPLFKNEATVTPLVHHQTVTIIFFGWSIGFGMCFGILPHLAIMQPLCRHLSYKIHFASYVTTLLKNGAILFREIRKM